MSVPHRIREVDLPSVLATLPEMELLTPGEPANIDLYICALGFEPRCLAIVDWLRKNKSTIATSLYLQYATNPSENQVNLRPLSEALRSICADIKSIEADSADFVERLKEIILVIQARNPEKRPKVVFDLSVVANRLIFRCMKALLESDIDLDIVYTEAETYYPTQTDYVKNPASWRAENMLGLEQGVSDIRVSRDFPGQQLDLLPDYVVLFPSFKAERTNAVLAKIDPSLITNPENNTLWIVGVPHLEENRWRIDAMSEINELNEFRRSIEVSTFNYKHTLGALSAVYEGKNLNFNLTISPLGSKMQALGTAIFCFVHPDIRVIFAIPKQYNAAKYSDGFRNLWSMRFGDVERLRGRLKSIGTISLEKIE